MPTAGRSCDELYTMTIAEKVRCRMIWKFAQLPGLRSRNEEAILSLCIVWPTRTKVTLC
jgi:hypothetical protein